MKEKVCGNILAIMLSFCMVVLTLPIAVSAQDGVLSGSGTAGDPFLIYDAEDLKVFRDKVNSGAGNLYGRLEADIVLNESLEQEKFSVDADGNVTYDGKADIPFEQWTPIGATQSLEYSGGFDGNSHTISGIYINNNNRGQGLFGYVEENGIIKNVGVINGFVKGNIYVGSVAGDNHGTVENCFNAATVYGGGAVGGVMGRNLYNNSIKCMNYGDVYGGYDVGGVIGSASNLVEFCYNYGNVSCIDWDNGWAIGGVAGEVLWEIKNCYNEGDVYGPLAVGGIAGQQVNSTAIENCYSIGKVSGGERVGGIFGSPSENGKNKAKNNYYLEGSAPETDVGTPISEQAFSDQGTFVNWDFNSVWQMADLPARPVLRNVLDSYGKTYAPYRIYDAVELKKIRDIINNGKENTSVILMADIVLNEDFDQEKFSVDENYNATYDNKTDIAFEQWIPIKTYSGVFDGNGHTISGIYINSDSEDQGFFSTIEDGAIVKNLGIVDSFILSRDSIVGGIAAVTYNSSIRNCYNSGRIIADGADVGGITGYIIFGTITHCRNMGEVSGASSVGGIVGYISGNTTVEKSYNTGTVTGTREVGGIVGWIPSTTYIFIENCYNTGNISALSTYGESGGISGFFSAVSNQHIKNCYNIGMISSEGEGCGNIIGDYYGDGSCFNSYFLTGDNPVNGIGTEMDSLAFKNLTLFDGWDFNDTWGMSDELGRPVLRTIEEGEIYSISGSGTEESPYMINNQMDLYEFNFKVNHGENNAYAELGNDIVLNPGNIKDDGTYTPSQNEMVHNWVSIGTEENPFNGVLEGKGHAVTGMYINKPEADNQGFFGYIGENGIVNNMGITDSYILGNNNIGTFAGINCGSIQASYTNAYVSGYSYVGGMTGINNNTIENSYTKGAVSGYSYVGGMAGANSADGAMIQNSYNTAEVYGVNTVGGMIGVNDAIAEYAYSTGKVYGVNTVGGFMGSGTGNVLNSYYLSESGTDNGFATPVSKDNFGKMSAFTDWNFDTVWIISRNLSRPILRTQPEGIIESLDGEGTKDNPYLIFSAEDLYEFRYKVNSGETGIFAVLMNDIILNTGRLDQNGNYYSPQGEQPLEWTPVASEENPYTGTFDGNGYTISGIYIKKLDSLYLGLFSCIGEGGIVKNIGIINSYISGKNYVGSIAGSNYGRIENSYTTSSVSGYSGVGAIAGINYSVINNCHNTGTVYGVNNVGGVSGSNDGGNMQNCYSVGTISGYSPVGGISGKSTGGSIQNCFYLDTSAENNGIGTAKTESEFSDKDTFTGWDFDTVWEFSEELNRPVLKTAQEYCVNILSGVYTKTQTGYELNVLLASPADAYTLSAALYDEQGRMISFSTEVCSGESEYLLNIPSTETGSYIKIYLWNGLENMKPLCANKLIEIF